MPGDCSAAIEAIATRLAATSAAARVAFDTQVEKTFELSQTYCPVDRGFLVNSGRNEVVSDTPGSHTRRLSYGNGEADYAFWVHERLELHHKSPTRAKFLESAVAETETDLVEGVKGVV